MLLTVKEIQKKLGIGRDVAYALMHSKNFPAIKLGGRYYVSEEALVQWLKRHEGKEVLI